MLSQRPNTQPEGDDSVAPQLEGQQPTIAAVRPALAAGEASRQPSPPGRRRFSAIVAAIVAAAAKLKALVLVLVKLKFLATAGTALVSVGAYSLLLSWPFAAGIAALLFVH